MKGTRSFVLAFFVLALGAGAAFSVHAQVVGVTLPSAPTGVSATVTAPLQISVSWSASTESSGTIEGYYVYRNGGMVATTAGTSLVDSVTSSGLYDYTVAAYDANGTVSAQSAAVSVTVIKDTTPPTQPTGVTITGSTTTNSFYATTTLTISWNASTDNVGVVGYDIYRNNVSITPSSSALTATSLTDVVAPGSYTYTIVAYDAAQNFSGNSAPAMVTITVDTNPPTTPKGLVAQEVSATEIDLSWASSTDVAGIAGYQIYRDGIQIASIAGPPYADTNVSLGYQYTYAVTAYDNAGNVSAQSVPVQAVVQNPTGATAPYLSSASLVGTSTVVLSWFPGSDALALSGYTLYRNNTVIASVASTTYMDMGLASGTYMYAVSETDVSGAVSATSSPKSVTVPVALSIVPPPTSEPVLSAPPVTVSTPVISTLVPATNLLLTQSLYYGLRNAQVKDLQSLLVANGDLPSIDATGFFGNLTLSAVEQFQCTNGIVCTGGPGWGLVGPKTRNVLNGLAGNAGSAGSGSSTTGMTAVPPPVSLSASASASSTASLAAEIQSLEALLASLEQQAAVSASSSASL
jgi:chitodextrinase